MNVLATVANGETIAHRTKVYHGMGRILESILVIKAELGGAAGVESHQRHEAHAIGFVVDRSHGFRELILQPVGEPECSNQETT